MEENQIARASPDPSRLNARAGAKRWFEFEGESEFEAEFEAEFEGELEAVWRQESAIWAIQASLKEQLTARRACDLFYAKAGEMENAVGEA